MENGNDKTAKLAPAADDDSDKWNAYDYYDCRSGADFSKETQEYIDYTRPWLKDAIAKRQAELKAGAAAAVPEKADPKKS
jgi:hypothetical protein